jgi:hypothetical protein
MRENKQIYAEVEKLSLDYEKARLSALSPAEKEQLAEYVHEDRTDIDWRKILRNSVCFERLREMYYRD